MIGARAKQTDWARNSMEKVTSPVLALTMGDPAGIGLELALKAWQARNALPLPFLLLAEPDCLRRAASACIPDVPLVESDFCDAARLFPTALPFKALAARADVLPGAPSAKAAPAIVEAIRAGVHAVHTGAAAAVVTNPIAKSVLYESGFAFPGHTEFLGALAREIFGTPATPVMLLWSNTLATVPVTLHIALKDVAKTLTQELITDVARTVHADFKRWFKLERPRLAICGLNPHAGEQGAMGIEEQTIISPAIAALQREGIAVSGPHPADTLFHARARAQYDVALCMYHDQALIPIKTVAFDEAVNVTLGLPFLRTSPDHGTAFDIAGTNRARADSLIAALTLAGSLWQKQHKTYSAPAPL